MEDNEKTNCFMLGGCWYIENDIAWLVDIQRNILFYLNMKSEKCDYVASIPNIKTGKFRLNQTCLKAGDDIYFLPDIGDRIWIYNLNNKKFKQIAVDNHDKCRIGIYKFWFYNNKIYAFSTGLKKVIEIDTAGQAISSYFVISDLKEEKIDSEIGIRVGNDIYFASSVANYIYQFSLETKQTTVYTIPLIRGGFQTICYDGKMFWLSGYRREIYVWNREQNSAKVLKDFPDEFGIYDFKGANENILDCVADEYAVPAFIDACFIGKYIWFIPFQTNKIIYADKDTYDIYAFEIEDENESRESMEGNILKHKYLFQYTRDDRYIGLFSLKNQQVIEIDCLEKKAERKSYFIEDESLARMVSSKNIFLHENNKLDQVIFTKWLSRKIKFADGSVEGGGLVNNGSIGESIYRSVMH